VECCLSYQQVQAALLCLLWQQLLLLLQVVGSLAAAV
jgi:hypothetical protein